MQRLRLWLHYSTGKETEALQYYEQALVIRREVGDRLGEGVTLNNLGLLSDDLGKQTEALEYYRQALAIHQEVGNRRDEGKTLNNLGVLYKKLGKETEALEYYQQALVIRQEVGNRVGEGITLYNIGTLFLEWEQYPTALAAILLAGRLYQQVLSPGLEAVEYWINELALRVEEEQFRELVSRVSLQPEHILELALSEWKEQSEN